MVGALFRALWRGFWHTDLSWNEVGDEGGMYFLKSNVHSNSDHIAYWRPLFPVLRSAVLGDMYRFLVHSVTLDVP